MSKVIADAKNHIKKIYPEISDVEIRVEREPTGEFVSKIHLRTRDGILYAVKKASTYRRSVDRSYHAILKQIERIKERRKFKGQKVWKELESA